MASEVLCYRTGCYASLVRYNGQRHEAEKLRAFGLSFLFPADQGEGLIE